MESKFPNRIRYSLERQSLILAVNNGIVGTRELKVCISERTNESDLTDSRTYKQYRNHFNLTRESTRGRLPGHWANWEAR